MYRVLSLGLVALALALFVGGPTRADDQNKADQGNTHTGKFVSAEGNNRFTMTSKDGKEHSHTLAADAKITCDGKECKLSDLKPGVMLRVTTDPTNKTQALKVEARTKGTFDTNRPGQENRDLNK